ncbi:EamA family transporter RarD [Phenylobacterium sp.]|jgi:chloramphenicol-sensitive protein RarD|uniref:EamA family transporter RarD n=1 Tax=Phenylobacterium sp. TaxID=1871053 RepID=UPI002F926ECD
MSPASAPGGDSSRLALGAGISAYVIWGLVPLAFQVIGRMGVSPWEILAHRTIWAVPTALVFVWLARQGRQSLAVLRTGRTMAWLSLSAVLIAINWLVFIWAVNSGRVLETSLGYYINPLLNIAAGALIFRERIDRIGQAAIALAVVGVVLQALALGHLPFVSLTLAISFCGYGIVRKRVAADAQTGLLVECLLLAIPSSVFVLWLMSRGDSVGTGSPTTFLWLLACGPATALPLMLFSWAARRVPLSAMGFLQFIAPTMTFFMGVLQGEPFTPLRAASFAFIWSGAAVFALGAWRRSRAVLAAEKLVEAPAE